VAQQCLEKMVNFNETTMKSLETQVGGSHYLTMKIQPVEFIIANNLPYLEGSILKYICRHRAKNGRQDLEKAAHYLQMLMETEYMPPCQ